jgi:hypothetical protein
VHTYSWSWCNLVYSYTAGKDRGPLGCITASAINRWHARPLCPSIHSICPSESSLKKYCSCILLRRLLQTHCCAQWPRGARSPTLRWGRPLARCLSICCAPLDHGARARAHAQSSAEHRSSRVRRGALEGSRMAPSRRGRFAASERTSTDTALSIVGSCCLTDVPEGKSSSSYSGSSESA